jgi:hypothetical protein
MQKQKTHAVFIPFMGKPQDIKGEWTNGNFKVILPPISRGAIVQLN